MVDRDARFYAASIDGHRLLAAIGPRVFGGLFLFIGHLQLHCHDPKRLECVGVRLPDKLTNG
jgi:hypothetical protein